MRRRRKNNSYMILFLLLASIGIGYAFLTSNLSIQGVTTISATNWDIHFDNVQENSSSTALVNQAANIDTDILVSYEVVLSKPGDFYEFTVDVVNEGTIDGMIETVSSKLNNVEITTLPSYMEYSITYADGVAILPNQILGAGDTDTYKVRVGFKKNISVSDLPSTNQTLALTFSVTYVQANENGVPRPGPAVIMPVNGEDDTTTFRSDTYRDNIKTLTLANQINPPANIIDSWDISVAQNGDVMAYIVQNTNDNTKYDLYIQGNGSLYANSNSSYLFFQLQGLDEINNLDILNTSNVTNMAYMFGFAGYNSTSFTLDLGNNFDTSHVTDMRNMFQGAGYQSTAFTLNLGDKFDTSLVTDMQYMFNATGYSSPSFTLDLGNKFDTGNVVYINHMFSFVGYYSTVFSLNLGNNFDTSKATNMRYMFNRVGYANPSFTLDLGSKFNTDLVTDMTYMFYNIGYANNTFELDLSTCDFTRVTASSNMFTGFKATGKVYVKDATARSWVISKYSTLTTDNVLIK